MKKLLLIIIGLTLQSCAQKTFITELPEKCPRVSHLARYLGVRVAKTYQCLNVEEITGEFLKIAEATEMCKAPEPEIEAIKQMDMTYEMSFPGQKCRTLVQIMSKAFDPDKFSCNIRLMEEEFVEKACSK